MNRLKGLVLGGLLVPVFFLQTQADEAAQASLAHPLDRAVLASALKEVAERDHINLSLVSEVGEIAAPGDAEVFWIAATTGKNTKQWLVKLTRSVTTPEEQKAHRGKEITKYLSWGSVVVFKSDVEALDLWIAGPVDTTVPVGDNSQTTAPARVRNVRVFVPRDFLRLGLDDSERVASHLTKRAQQLLKEDPKFNMGQIYALDKPVKPKNVEYAKPVAERIGFTPEMEQAWMGGYVALEAFYELANHVPELAEIAEVACKKPAFWKLPKMVRGTQFKTWFGGLNKGPVNSGAIGCLPVPLESFDAPFSFAFGDDLIVSGAMLVTKPMPPLDVSAGILALIAVHPDDKARVVELRAISSTRGPASGVKSAVAQASNGAL